MPQLNPELAQKRIKIDDIGTYSREKKNIFISGTLDSDQPRSLNTFADDYGTYIFESKPSLALAISSANIRNPRAGAETIRIANKLLHPTHIQVY